MPSTRNNEDYTKASLVRRLSIAVPTLIPLMNNINNRISCHTSKKKDVHGVATVKISTGFGVE